MPQYSIPKRVGLDDIKDIIKAYYVEGAHQEPVSTKTVEDTAQLPDRVGRQTDFLEEVGLLELVGRERKLTAAGEEIAEALMGGGEEQAKVRMRELFTDWDFISKIQGFVQMQGPVEESQLEEYIKANAKSDDQRGKETLIETLLWADILDQSEDGLYSVAQPKSPKGDESKPQRSSGDGKPISEKGAEKPSEKADEKWPKSPGKSELNIEFSFTADDDPQQIKKVIRAAREALTDNFEDDGVSSTN